MVRESGGTNYALNCTESKWSAKGCALEKPQRFVGALEGCDTGGIGAVQVFSSRRTKALAIQAHRVHSKMV